MAPSVKEPRYVDVFEFVASALVELGHLLEFLRDGVAIWRGDIFSRENRRGVDQTCALSAEGVGVLIVEKGRFKLVVGHG